MNKIVTLTISPCIDKNTYTDHIVPEEKLRCDRPVFEAGGGGINVSKAIKNLGGNSIAVFPEGGAGGELLENLLHEEGITTHSLPLEPWTRENLNVVSRESDRQFRFVMPGNPLSESDTQKLIGLLQEHKDASVLVVSGSIPKGTPEHIFDDLAKFSKENDIKLIWDTSGDAVHKSLERGNVYLLKPNHGELCELMGIDKKDDHDVDELAEQLLQKYDLENVVVSLGAQGALWISKHGDEQQIVPPPVKIVSTVGAGDSQIGGMVLKLAQGESMAVAVRYGVAVGTATITQEGSQLAKKEDAERLFKRIMKKHPIQTKS